MQTTKHFLPLIIFICLLGTSLVYASAVQANSNRLVAMLTDTSGHLVQCNLPRPEICYEIYQPVCAVVTQNSNHSNQQKITFANDCKACADPSVVGFVKGGACEDSR